MDMTIRKSAFDQAGHLFKDFPIAGGDRKVLVGELLDLVAESCRDRLTHGSQLRNLTRLAYEGRFEILVGSRSVLHGAEYSAAWCRFGQATLKFSGLVIGNGSGSGSTSAMLMAITRLFRVDRKSHSASALLEQALRQVVDDFCNYRLDLSRVAQEVLLSAERHAIRSVTSNESVIDRMSRRAWTLGIRLRNHAEQDRRYVNGLTGVLYQAMTDAGFAPPVGGTTTFLPDSHAT